MDRRHELIILARSMAAMPPGQLALRREQAIERSRTWPRSEPATTASWPSSVSFSSRTTPYDHSISTVYRFGALPGGHFRGCSSLPPSRRRPAYRVVDRPAPSRSPRCQRCQRNSEQPSPTGANGLRCKGVETRVRTGETRPEPATSGVVGPFGGQEVPGSNPGSPTEVSAASQTGATRSHEEWRE